MQEIKIGTRGSKLALAQSAIVENLIKTISPETKTKIIIIKTKGDKILDKPLSELGDKGLFVNEIEEALISKDIDIAIHSAKDLPTQIKDELEIISTPQRADARDILITLKKHPINTIGTSSPRRSYYIKKLYPNIQTKNIRGNIDTRLKKLSDGEYDAIILAKAGLDRLNLTENNFNNLNLQPLAINQCIPAACQGIIAIESRKNYDLKNILLKINDNNTYLQFKIERKILELLQVTCSDISAVYSEIIDDKNIFLYIMYKGKTIITKENISHIFESIPNIISKIKNKDM